LMLDREVKDKNGMATSETNLAYVLYHCADYERAKGLLRESLRLYQEAAAVFSAAWALVAWAGIERAQSHHGKAAALIGAANALAASAGIPFEANDQRDREDIEATIRVELSKEEWQKAQERGRIMSMDEAIAYALGDGSA